VTDCSSSCHAVGAAQHDVGVGQQAACTVGLIYNVETVRLDGHLGMSLLEVLVHPVDLVLTDEALGQNVPDTVVPQQTIGVQKS